jgi:nucleotide-binding universal stress UspA family protein
MESHDIPNGAVVVGVDGSEHSDHALDRAARHARAEARDLVLLHAVAGTSLTVAVLAKGGVDPSPYLDQIDEAGRAVLDAAVARIASVLPRERVHTLVVRSDPRTALLEASARASVVVIGSRGRGPVRSLVLGSVSVAVAGHAGCPVVVVRPHHPGKVRRGVLVGADGRPESQPALEFAFRQAAAHDLPLTVVHIVWDALAVASDPQVIGPDDVEYERAGLALSESIAGLGEKFPEVHVQRTLVRGTALTGLLGMADAMDLVVMGHQHGNPASGPLFGSVALGVLERASTVVAVVPEA